MKSKPAEPWRREMERSEELTSQLKRLAHQLGSGPLALLSPESQYFADKTEFQNIALRAKRGDLEAVALLQDSSLRHLESSKQYFASSTAYFEDLAAVKGVIYEVLSGRPAAEDVAVLAAGLDRADFDVVARQVREAIERNEPEAALDRLHTWLLKFLRSRCERRGIEVVQDKPLHSLMGEYVKTLAASGAIESEMTSRILKVSSSILDSFNAVRNNKSLAHDNIVLNRAESRLIYDYVVSLVRFIRSVENNIELQNSDRKPE